MSDLNTNLDNPDLNVPEYFKSYIKEKKNRRINFNR